MTKGPLDGIRVVDLTRIFSGPICGRVPAKPFAMSDAAVGVTHRSARRGEDTRSVLADDLGLSHDEIARLIAQGAVQTAD